MRCNEGLRKDPYKQSQTITWVGGVPVAKMTTLTLSVHVRTIFLDCTSSDNSSNIEWIRRGGRIRFMLETVVYPIRDLGQNNLTSVRRMIIFRKVGYGDLGIYTCVYGNISKSFKFISGKLATISLPPPQHP